MAGRNLIFEDGNCEYLSQLTHSFSHTTRERRFISMTKHLKLYRVMQRDNQVTFVEVSRTVSSRFCLIMLDKIRLE